MTEDISLINSLFLPQLLRIVCNRLFADFILNTFYKWLNVFKEVKNTQNKYYYNYIPFDTKKIMQNVYINLNKLDQNQLNYISYNVKLDKPKLWCDLKKEYV